MPNETEDEGPCGPTRRGVDSANTTQAPGSPPAAVPRPNLPDRPERRPFMTIAPISLAPDRAAAILLLALKSLPVSELPADAVIEIHRQPDRLRGALFSGGALLATADL